MTISTSSFAPLGWNGDDVTVNFDVTFPFQNATDLVVLRLEVDSTFTTLTKDAGGDDGYTVSGTVVTLNTAVATGEKLYITRFSSLKQLLDLVTNKAFDPEGVESLLDQLILAVQELKEISGSRTPQLAINDDLTVDMTLPLKALRASMFFAFDANGKPIASSGGISPALPVSSFVETLLDDANSGSFLTTLGFSNFIQSLINDTDAETARDTLLVPKQNLIINGGCRVAQYGSVACVLTTRTYGGCDRIAVTLASFTTVTAGNIVQATGLSWTATGYAQKISGLSTTGSGTVAFDTRLEARDTGQKNGKTVICSAKVSQDTGGNLTATAYLYKANSSDDFSGKTLLATGTGVTVPTGTPTEVSVSVDLGSTDASNGLECRVVFSGVGAVTTKNFWLGDFQLTEGSIVTPILMPRFGDDLAGCLRYLPSFVSYNTDGSLASGVFSSTSNANIFFDFQYPPRVSPTGISISSAAHFALNDAVSVQSTVTSVTFSNASIRQALLDVAGTGTPYTQYRVARLTAVSASARIIFTGCEL